MEGMGMGVQKGEKEREKKEGFFILRKTSQWFFFERKSFLLLNFLGTKKTAISRSGTS